MSLAPSPTASVAVSGMFRASATSSSASLLPSAPRIGRPTVPVSAPFATCRSLDRASSKPIAAATRVVVPAAIPPLRLATYGVDGEKLVRYPGLKEEYYLADFEPDAGALDPWEIDPERTLVVVRTPPDVSLYHRRSNPLFPQVLDYLGRHEAVHAIVLPRTEEQREYVRSLVLPSLIVPEHAVDAQSLIAFSDLVVSAGGTMNREAVALGVPVYTTFGGRLGGVDEALIREKRLIPLSDPRSLDVRKRDREREPVRRGPALMLKLLLSAGES